MTISAMATRQSYHPIRSAAARNVTPHAGLPASRSFEVTSLRADDSLHISQHKVPALPLFDSAFAAFARGTLINTVNGPTAIEDLQPGDMVNTSSGEASKIMWIGSSTFVPSNTTRRMPIIRIMADTFGEGRPASFLTVGPSARLLQTPDYLRGEANGTRMFTPARSFVDGVNVIEICPPTPVRMFHICLTRHAAINVGGLEMETFHPGSAATRSVSHSMRDLFLSLFSHVSHVSDFGPLAHPRAPDKVEEDVE